MCCSFVSGYRPPEILRTTASDTNRGAYLSYQQLYGEGLGAGGLPKPEAIQKWEDTLGELVSLFKPDYIFVDGGTADIYVNKKSDIVTEAFRRIVANYYNDRVERGYEPVLTFKRESLYKEEAIPDYEGGLLFDIAPYKWQTHSSICGWFYRNGERITPSSTLFRRIMDVISKNGNLLISLGLKGDGSMQQCEVDLLKDMAKWTHTNGEAIYATRPWLAYGVVEPGQDNKQVAEDRKGVVFDDPERTPMGRLKIFEGDIRYTRSKDGQVVYASRLAWPETPFTLTSFSATGVGKNIDVHTISLLGSDEKIKWTRTESGITVTPPEQSVFDDRSWPVIFKITTK